MPLICTCAVMEAIEYRDNLCHIEECASHPDSALDTERHCLAVLDFCLHLGIICRTFDLSEKKITAQTEAVSHKKKAEENSAAGKTLLKEIKHKETKPCD